MPNTQSFLGGLLGGFNKVAAQGRADSAARSERQSAREQQLLLHIATTSDDQDVADAAASALVESTMGAKPPKGGYLQRLVGGGPDAVNPAVSGIMSLIRGGGAARPAAGEVPGGPSPAGPGGAAPPPRAQGTPGSLAQSPTTISQTGVQPGPGALSPPPTVRPNVQQGPATLPQMGTAQAPPAVNAPPDSAQASQATASPMAPMLAPPVQPPPGVIESLATRATTAKHVWMTPLERQRQSNRLHAEGIQLDLESKVQGAMKVWDATHPGASDADKQEAHDQIVEKELGTAPKWLPVPGTVTGNLLPPDAMDSISQVIGAEGRTAAQYYIRQQAGNRFRFLPTSAPAAASSTAPINLLAKEMFGQPVASLSPEQVKLLNAEQSHRTAMQAGRNTAASAASTTAEMAKRTKAVTVMYPDGTFQGALETGDGRILNSETEEVIPGAVVVSPSAVLPKTVSAAGKQTLTGLGVMRQVNKRIAESIEAAGLTNDNNPLPQLWEKWLYTHGMTPQDAALLQNIGVSEAYGLRGLVGGRPNQTLLDIYKLHLAQVGDSPKLIYEKVKGLEPTIDTVQQAVLTAEGATTATRVRGEGPAGTGGATTALPANYDGTREQNGVKYHVKTDASGKVILAEPIPPKPGGRGGGA